MSQTNPSVEKQKPQPAKNKKSLGNGKGLSTRAQAGYEGYSKKTGGKTFDGRPLPLWNNLPQDIREAWEAAIEAALAVG